MDRSIDELDTLKRVRDDEACSLLGRRFSIDGRHFVVDIFNHQPPQDARTLCYSEATLWYEIDDLSREAGGRSGRGPHIVGHMPRATDCRPVARLGPLSAALVEHYEKGPARKIERETRGMSIGLQIPSRDSAD